MKILSFLSNKFVCILIASLIFFIVFNPFYIKVQYYVVPFVLLGALVYMGSLLLLRIIFMDMALGKRRLIAGTISFCSLVSLALSSLGQLDVADMLVLGLLVLVGMVYVRKNDLFA